MKYGFDNEKYLKIQSEHIKERIASSVTSFISSSAENYLMTTMQAAFCPDSSLTAN